jgi:nitrile hydratase beta subunit
VFHHDWEKRALALTVAANGCGMWNIDISRHARETLPPAAYLSKSYYDIWISGLEKLLRQTGMAGADELAQGAVLTPPRPVRGRLAAENVAAMLASGTPYDRPASAPAQYAPGDSIRTKVMHPSTHTRLPRYARGKTGIVEAVRGCFVFPDSNAHGKGEDPRWCYAVTFTGQELWGEDADPSLTVTIDAWEPYLERA